MPSLLRRLWRHLSATRRRQLAMLPGLMIASALAEVISLGSVVPFLAALVAPDKLLANAVFAKVARALPMDFAGQQALTWTIVFIVATVIATAVRMMLLWANTRVGFATGADLSIDVYRRTLYQPYGVHVGRNSSEVISGIVHQVDTVVFGVLLACLALISAAAMIVAIMVALIMIDPVVAVMAAGAFGTSYALIAWFARHQLARNSRRISDEKTRIIRALQEGLGGIRDVLLDGTQPVYCEIFRRADQPLRQAQGAMIVIGQSPRYLMEAVGILVLAALAYGLSGRQGGMAAAIPVLGGLALGAQRLLPALQQSYHAWISIAASAAALKDVLDLLDQPLPAQDLQPPPPPLPFQHAIDFDAVSFRYANEGPWVLKGLSLRIQKGSRVGLVGMTGSGKSTAVDLLMGLLEPTTGRVLADGQPISGGRVRAWQQRIAHVPQSIFLADTTIAANIALGVPHEAIDMSRVHSAARQAEIADFIESRPEGYEALVGERGIRLSGGQRQRIGIARALYKHADVLVFDEATSALDNATEQAIMRTIGGLSRDLTIILVAHRLSTVKRCDTIIELHDGAVAAQGTYAELLESSSSFRQAVHAAG